ncbi:hypothetical protein [Catellatospora sichuanensis]|uniref:hypothetical protein n=1 Tax=Catellatospora sichuanensis TaxID=1969805 RepID=UPI001181F347|nr:hypothetical protein [Catellatospora sichuanensis]
MHPDLQAAVAELYAVYARHPRAERIGYCGHCVDDAEALVLQRVPLRRLTAADLARFTFKLMSTWGDEADLRHFLPRILELFATGEQRDGHLLTKTLSNVRYHGAAWGPEELAALEGYLMALMRQILTDRGSHLQVTALLEGAAENGHTVEPYLAVWAQEPGETATVQLTTLIDDFGWTYSRDDRYHREVRAWLRTGIPQSRLEAAFLATDDPEAASSFGQALEQLEFLTV